MIQWNRKRVQLREHNNGRIAEVYIQRDGKFYACEALASGEAARSIKFHDNVPTLKLARVLADRVAHPSCHGECPPWREDPNGGG